MSGTHRFVLSALAALVACALLAGPADAAEKYTRGLRYPSLTADGKQVVFSYRGDIWITDTDGKSPARRLTIHEAQDTLPRVSPDGTRIAFSSTRDGSYDIYVMPVTGGEAERISFHSGLEIMCDWSPDGKSILFASDRDPSRFRIDLYEMAVTGGPVRRLTRDGGRDGAYSADGKSIVYVRGFNTIYQDNYSGSANYDIYTMPAAGGLPTRIIKSEGNERYPFFSKDGKEIWFVAEEKGVANFYAVPVETNGTPGGDRRQLTKYTGNDVQRPALSADGKTMVFERWGRLHTADLSQAEPKDVELPLVVSGDRRHSGREKRTVNSGAQQVHLSKDGARMAFSLHGDIWITAGNGGDARRVTSGPHKDEWPRFSPNGQTLAFQSDRSGNSDIWLLDLGSGGLTQLTDDKAGDFFHNWSPDGGNLVFCSERSGNREIWSVEVASKKATRLTNHDAADDDPCYSPDGRFVAFDSAREGNQAIFIMDADGGNVRRVTDGSAFMQVPNWSPDGALLSYEIFNTATGSSQGVFVVSAAGGPSMQLSRDGSTACWSPRGDFIYFSVGATGREEIYRVPAPTSVENREKVTFNGTVDVDVREELANLFDEAWVTLGNGFYDAKMHGVDWKQMREKYRDMAIDAENKDEFHNVIRQMLAELNASHLGIFGGSRPSNAVASSAPATGYLGVDFADAAGPSGGRTVQAIFTKGPADQAGLRVGDEVIAIQGKKVDATTDLDQLLAGTVGKELRVRFRPITADGPGEPREETVKPIAGRQLQQMEHGRWVMTCAKTVQEETKGEIGYIHLDAMNPQNLQRFQRAVAEWNRRPKVKGMILDVRENGGGNIHQQLLEILTAVPYARVSMRGSPIKMTQPALYWDKPVVVLINERSFSDAEVFPFIFKARGVGKVIGVPTPGGVIGTNDITLSDGSTFRIPRTRYEGMDGTNLEGLGVQPDILVELTSEDRIKGNDRQLAKAIEVVTAEVRGNGGKTPATPKPAPKPAPVTRPDTAPDAPRPDRPG
ncbi:MAG: S41 family peptidase, partial [Planctomycetota bacterium]|nr:S41 family peptidase [Planctomycetota bacterium]